MASDIDPTQPTYGEATTQSVRDNFAAAKAEIEALQSQGPFLPLEGGELAGPLYYTATGGAVARSAQDRAAEVLYAEDYGVVPNAPDNTAEMLDFFTAIQAKPNGVKAVLPSGTIRVTSSLSLHDLQLWTLEGSGTGSTTLLYTGTDTTTDILQFTNCGYFDLTGFRVDSSTAMTSGTAFHLDNVVHAFLNDVKAAGQSGLTHIGSDSNKHMNLWNGFWFDKVDYVVMTNFEAMAQNDGVRVNGSVGPGAGADLYLQFGKIAFGLCGLHCGGGFGGLNVDVCGLIANWNNVIIDQALVARNNREIFFGPGAACDTSGYVATPTAVGSVNPGGSALGDNVILDDPNGGYFNIKGWVATTKAPFNGSNIRIKRWGFYIKIDGCIISFAHGTGDGVRIETATPLVMISPGTQFDGNQGYGINQTVRMNAVLGAPTFTRSGAGDLSPTTTLQLQAYPLALSSVIAATAAGTTQADATPITTSYTRVRTATVGSGVILPIMPAGTKAEVLNATTTPFNVYPTKGWSIYGTATDAPQTLYPGYRMEVIGDPTDLQYMISSCGPLNMVKQTGVAVTTAAIYAALTNLGLIAP